MFFNNLCFPFPSEAMLAILTIIMRRKYIQYAFIGASAAVCAGFFIYYLGFSIQEYSHMFFSNFVHCRLNGNKAQVFLEYLSMHSLYFIILFCMIPFPYKIVCLCCGYIEVPILTFACAALIGRGARFLVVTFLCRLYGRDVLNFLQQKNILKKA